VICELKNPLANTRAFFFIIKMEFFSDSSESNKIEGKRVHWKLKGCYSNALNYKDMFGE
jgi:hypothetical protein